MDDFYLLALASIVGLGPALFKQILKKANDFESFKKLNSRAFEIPGMTPSLQQQLILLSKQNKKIVEQLKKQKDILDKEEIFLIHFEDDFYPKQLLEIAAAPPVIFVKGNVKALSEQQIAIVGTRKPTPYGKVLTESFASALANKELIITSGLALGVDSISHQSTVNLHKKTIAVMGSGIDIIYPRRNKKLAAEILENGGAIVSEFAPGFFPHKSFFPRRNRIISGLSLGVLVVEAAQKSGSLITAKYALEQNREVFAIPGALFNPLSRGCHQLIRQGAVLVESVEQIIDELPNLSGKYSQSMLPGFEPPPELNSLEKKLLEQLSGHASSLDFLASQLNEPLNTLQVAVTKLELKGLVERTAGHIMATRKYPL